MAEPPGTVFLERRTYRRRRLADLARFLPLAGFVLLMVPLQWRQGDAWTSTSHAIMWIFGVWLALVTVAAWLSSRRVEIDLNDPDGRATAGRDMRLGAAAFDAATLRPAKQDRASRKGRR
ncbi:MAG: hypothetical protein ACRBBU_08235 [Pseudooceanicola sp.]